MVIIRHLAVPLTGIRFQDANVEALLGDEILGKGTLYITEELIMWLKETGGEGFTIQYKKMTLHAISRDPNVHPRNCLYVMINGTLDANDAGEGPPSPTYDDGDEDDTTEVRFVPETSSRLDEMYKAVQDCTLLHPDASSDMSESEDDDIEEEDLVGGDASPPLLLGMGGGRIIHRRQEEQELQLGLGALQQHFGDRLIFEHRPGGSNGNAPSAPIQPTPEQLMEMYAEDEEEGDEAGN